MPRRPRVFVQTFGGCKPRHSACCCWYHTARARPLGSDCMGAREGKGRHFHRRRRRDAPGRAQGLRADAQVRWLSVYTQVTGEGEQCALVVFYMYMPFRHALPTTVTPKNVITHVDDCFGTLFFVREKHTTPSLAIGQSESSRTRRRSLRSHQQRRWFVRVVNGVVRATY